jgi:hypothetical protein
MAPPGIVVAIVPTAHEDYLRLECSGTFNQDSAGRNREP